MFFIMGVSPRRGGEITLADKNGRRYTLFYVGNCLSLFFIPVFTFSKTYYISVGNNAQVITKDDYIDMRARDMVDSRFENMSNVSDEFRQAYEATQQGCNNGTEYANEYCPVCKNKLEGNFAFCPYCGQKQPRK